MDGIQFPASGNTCPLHTILMTTLQQYFGLQLTMFKRQLIEFGLTPLVGIIFILLGFYGFSFYLFTKTEYANYLYIIISIGIILQYSEINRNDFLKFVYPKQHYFKIRVLENLITVLPFILFLCYKAEFFSVLLLIVISILLSLLNTTKKISATIPTPFYRKPFEFIVGFRKSFVGFFLAYFLTAMSLTYQNFNLGIFSLLLIILLCLSFYSEPENEFFVWIHKTKVNGFLFDKIITAIIFSTIISFPITIVLLIFFQTNIKTILGFQAIGYCYLLTVILAKYAAYPKKMNLPQGILLALSITMPPLLLVLVPFFYIQSKNRLNEILK